MDNRLEDATAVWVMEEEEQSVRRYNEMIRFPKDTQVDRGLEDLQVGAGGLEDLQLICCCYNVL